MDWYKGKRTIARAIRLDLTHYEEHYASALRRYVGQGVRWLDLGCGHRIVPDWAMAPAEQERLVKRATFLVGVDLHDGILRHPLLTYGVIGMGGALPFKDRAFDLVTANMVVEHVREPTEFLRDIFRVLRPGGRFLFVTPNLMSPLIFASQLISEGTKKYMIRYLEQREETDVFPAYYRMNKPQAITKAAEGSGFETAELSVIASCGEFDRLGPVSWIECVALKGMEVAFHGRLQPDILGVLQRPATA